jgi:hypothetical protein
MLDFRLETQIAIAVAHCRSELRFQAYKAFDLFVHVRQFALEHGLDI